MTDSLHSLLLQAAPVLPVVVIEDAAQALPLAEALLAAGQSVMEITLRTPAALAAICAISHELPQMRVGAGTLISPSQLPVIRQAGACFAVSPGFSPELVQATEQANMPWLPGVQTASEVMQAVSQGLSVLKLFPAGESGLELLAQLQGPFPDVLFCPSGGINQHNLPSFMARSNVVCCGGSWLTSRDLLAAADWALITQSVQQLRQDYGKTNGA